MSRQFLCAFCTFIYLYCYPSQAVGFSQNLSKDVCHRQITLLETVPVRQLFEQINANIPRDLSTLRIFSSIDDFNKCLSINERVNNTNVQGKYCTISVTIPNPLNPRLIYYMPDNATLERAEKYEKSRQPYRFFVQRNCPSTIFKTASGWKKLTKTVTLGVCIPKICRTEDALDFVLNNKPFVYENKIIEDIEFDDKVCQIFQETQLTIADHISISVLAIILILTTTSTIYDINHQIIKQLDSKPNRVYSSFSVYTNTRRLVDSTSRISSDTVLCVNGIRAISIAWEIAGHVNRKQFSFLDDQWSDLKHYFFETEHYVVDTFFLLSGFFVVYTNVKKFTAAPFVKNLPVYYLNRISRLYPLLCTVILLDISIFHHLRESYDVSQVIVKINSCWNTWWILLLFINNIVFTCDNSIGKLKLCLGHSWYLAVDMQLYIISPLVMIWLFGKKKVAWTALIITLVISLTLCTILAFLWNFPYLMISTLLPFNRPDSFATFYDNTVYRSPPFFIGMMLGYYLHCIKKKQTKLNKILVFFLWILITLIFMWTFYITKEIIYTYNQILINLLGAYQRSIWSTAVAFMIFLCFSGYGGPLNWFLSLNMWKLLSRLNYAMYLFHRPLAQIIRLVNTGIGSSNTIWVDLQQFACLYMITFIISFVSVILVEMPVITLQAIIQGPRRKEVVENENHPEIHKDVGVEA